MATTRRVRLPSEYAIRQEACRCAAVAMQGACSEGDIAQRLWSLAVFFENYLSEGAAGTQKDFGYKKPIKLRVVKPRAS